MLVSRRAEMTLSTVLSPLYQRVFFLELAAICPVIATTSLPVAAMPLSLAYFDQELPYGMVVIDITDQTRVGYGIVAFAAYDMLWLDHDQELDWDAWGPDFGPQKMELEDDRQRVALSGSDYIIRFGYEEAENMQRFYVTCPDLNLLEKVPVVEACVFNGTRSTFSFFYMTIISSFGSNMANYTLEITFRITDI